MPRKKSLLDIDREMTSHYLRNMGLGRKPQADHVWDDYVSSRKYPKNKKGVPINKKGNISSTKYD